MINFVYSKEEEACTLGFSLSGLFPSIWQSGLYFLLGHLGYEERKKKTNTLYTNETNFLILLSLQPIQLLIDRGGFVLVEYSGNAGLHGLRYIYFFFSFLAMPTACGISWARD